MNQVSWAQHSYIDLSDLNAKWDQALPAVAGLGSSNGAISGNSLGIRGLGQDPHLPWREYSADTVSYQEELNKVLAQMYRETGDDVLLACPGAILTEDGKLGPATCGLADFLAEDGWPVMIPGTCQSFAEPMCTQQTTYSAPVVEDEAVVEEATVVRRSPNWVMLGAGVAVIAVGAAIALKKKR